MTILEALLEADESKPNQIEKRKKIAWLSEVDGRIYHDIILTHKRGADAPGICPRYDAETADDTVLLCPEPYSVLYKWYLQAQMDLMNEETDRYQNSMLAFNAAYGDYSRKYHREHMPLQRVNKLQF